ncbi:hypothetical protein CaCOL14_013189 [Colletotrichum acutatum]
MAPESQSIPDSTLLRLPLPLQLPLPDDSTAATIPSQSTTHANDNVDLGIERAVAELNRIAAVSKQSILDAWNTLLVAFSSKINRLDTLNARLEAEPFPHWLRRTIPQSTLSLVLASVFQDHWQVHVKSKRNEVGYRNKAVTHLHLVSHWDLYLFFGPAAVASRACWLKLPADIDGHGLFHRLLAIRGLGPSYLDQWFSPRELTAAKKLGPAGAATPSAAPATPLTIPTDTSLHNMEKVTAASSRDQSRLRRRDVTLPSRGELSESGSSNLPPSPSKGNNAQDKQNSTGMSNHEVDDSGIGDIDISEMDLREGSGIDLNTDMARPGAAAQSAHSTQNALNCETSRQAQQTTSSHEGFGTAGEASGNTDVVQCVLDDINDAGRLQKIRTQINADAIYATVATKDKTESEGSIVQLREKTLARLCAIEEQTDGCVDNEED